MTGDQFDFDFTRTHSRRSDPRTSQIAAADAQKFAASQAGRVLAALKHIGSAGKTRIAKASGLNDVQVARRLADLERLGIAAPLNQTEPSASGKPERIWIAA